MKRIATILFFTLLFAGSLFANNVQTKESDDNRFPFSIKAYPFRGMYLDKNSHYTKFGPIFPAGVHMGLEFPSLQQRPWQQYLGNPTVGIGLSWLDFGKSYEPGAAKLGMGIAVYPYILLDAIDSEHFQMRFKVAGGAGFVSEHWYTQEDQDPDHYYEPTVNTIFGCTLNAYLNAGINLNVPITRYLAFGGEFGFFHMSNGRTCMPNVGVNSLYGSVGVTATFNSDVEKKPVRFPDLPYRWSLNITGAVGAQKSAIADPHRFLISTFHTGAIYHATNWYGIGAGLDVFYNGAIDNNTDRSLYRKRPEGYSQLDKVRAGIALNNEFKFGLVTAIVDWGFYFFNPSRHYYDNDHPIYGYGKRPLFYKNDGAGTDEAFHYIRLGAKCRVWDNMYVKMAMKCHLHIAEYIEFGIGYQIPFFKKSYREAGHGKIFHHRKDWYNKL